MRRVDVAMRQVLGDALAQDLKDPRVGFVTVTDVKTSPDLRHARVYVSVLGDEPPSEASLDGLRSAHGFLQSRRRGRAAPQAHAGADLRARPHGRARGAARARSSTTRSGARERRRREPARRRASRSSTRSARRTSSCSLTHEHPDGDALGSLVGMHGILCALGKDSVMFMAADEFPLPHEYRFFALRRPSRAARRTTSTSARSSSSTAATSTATRSRRSRATTRTSSTSTTTTTTRASARSTTSCRTPRARPRSCGTSCTALGVDADARDRRGALRRARHRHRQVHVREHRPARARDGGRADRRPGSTCTRSTAASTRACRTAKLELLGRALAQRRALRRRHAHARATSTATTSAWPAPRRATPRASSTTCASVEGTKVAALVRELLGGDGAAQRRSRCARPTARRRLGDRPRAGAAAATAAPPASHRAVATTSSSRSCASRSPPSS